MIQVDSKFVDTNLKKTTRTGTNLRATQYLGTSDPTTLLIFMPPMQIIEYLSTQQVCLALSRWICSGSIRHQAYP
eukprot:SAG11_NODE_1866_length_4152_cov_15.643967_4_plen_75_part_00